MKSLLIWLSRSKKIPKFTKKHKLFWRFASRFVAGETLEEVLKVVKTLNNEGMIATLDHLGENTEKENDANDASKAYVEALREIRKLKLDCNVSLKLTQMGLDLGKDICLRNVKSIVEEAKKDGNFIRIDMEGSRYTQTTLDIFGELRKGYDRIGVVIQSYLHRSAGDIEDLLQTGTNIRIVKGAYREPKETAFERKSETDKNYIALMERMLSKEAINKGCKVAIATHDEKILHKAKEMIKERNIGKEHYEFQMLYGIRQDLQKELAKEHPVRIYVPYGKEWYPYFMRRLAERPANLLFLLKNLLRP